MAIISIALALIADAQTPEELERFVQNVEARMTELERPKDEVPSALILPEMASLLHDIESIRRASVQMKRGGKFFSRWQELEARWIDYLESIHLTSRAEMYRLIQLANINRETHDRIQRKLPDLPPHPLAVEKFRRAAVHAVKLSLDNAPGVAGREELLENGSDYIWISVPSIDLLDSSDASVANEHFLYGFEKNAPVIDLTELGEVEVWDVSESFRKIRLRTTDEILSEAYRKKPKSMQDFRTQLEYALRLETFSPGHNIVSAKKQISTVRWNPVFDIDALINTDKPLDPSVWLTFMKGPMQHFEPIGLHDPLPQLTERGRFSIFEKIPDGPVLVYFAEKEYLALKPKLPQRPKIVDLLNVAFDSRPVEFFECGLYLRKIGLLRPPPGP